jgi:putative phage-type endonuclease
MKRTRIRRPIDDDEWLTIRRKHIGGSEIAAICGLNKWRSAIDVWLDKMGRAPKREDNEAMRQGRELEDYCARRFMEVSNKKLINRNYMDFAGPDYLFLADIDRQVTKEDAGWEGKTSKYIAGWGNEQVPPSYYVQCQWYMGVLGWDHWYISGLIYGQDFITRKIDRDDSIIEVLQQQALDFWNNSVLTGEMPAPDGSESAEQALKEIYPVSNGMTVTLDGLANDAERYSVIGEQIKALTKEQDAIKQAIEQAMGESESAVLGAYRADWKIVSGRTTFDSKRFREDEPETYEKYIKVGKPTRRFMMMKNMEE